MFLREGNKHLESHFQHRHIQMPPQMYWVENACLGTQEPPAALSLSTLKISGSLTWQKENIHGEIRSVIPVVTLCLLDSQVNALTLCPSQKVPGNKEEVLAGSPHHQAPACFGLSFFASSLER